MRLESSDLWQGALEILHIGGELNWLGNLGFLDEVGHFLVLDAGDRDQEIGQQLEFGLEVLLWTVRARPTLLLTLGCWLRCRLAQELNLGGTRLQTVVDDGFEGCGLDVLLVVVDLIQDVESDESLVFLKEGSLDQVAEGGAHFEAIAFLKELPEFLHALLKSHLVEVLRLQDALHQVVQLLLGQHFY